MLTVEYVVVLVAGFVLGGWAVPLGFLLGLGPVATFLTATAGGLIGCWVFLLGGERVAAWVRRRRRDGSHHSPSAATAEAAAADGGTGDDDGPDAGDAGRVARFVDRYGVRGLGIVGPIFPGVTASVIGGLAVGLDRRSLGRWMTIGIVVIYALYVLAMSLLVALF